MKYPIPAALDTRVKLDRSVSILLCEFARLTGRSKLDVASAAIRAYIQECLRQEKPLGSRSNEPSTKDTHYWQNRAARLQKELLELETYALLAQTAKRFGTVIDSSDHEVA
jgi:hypothetical protein